MSNNGKIISHLGFGLFQDQIDFIEEFRIENNISNRSGSLRAILTRFIDIRAMPAAMLRSKEHIMQLKKQLEDHSIKPNSWYDPEKK